MTRLAVWIGLTSVLLSGLGCANGILQKVEGDPNDPNVLYVHGRVWGVTHLRDDMKVEVDFGQWRGRGPLPLDPNLDDQEFVARIERWGQNFTGRKPAPGWVRVRFLLRDRRWAAEKEWLAPIEFDPDPDREARRPPTNPAPQQPPAAEHPSWPSVEHVPPGETPETLPTLSQDVDAPSPVAFPQPVRAHVHRAASPQYATFTPHTGTLRLLVDVRSHETPDPHAPPSWVRLELLDADGISLGRDYDLFVQVNPGDELRQPATWSVDGAPVILKLSSGSPSGHAVEVSLESGDPR